MLACHDLELVAPRQLIARGTIPATAEHLSGNRLAW
jgi:hypothetical protein